MRILFVTDGFKSRNQTGLLLPLLLHTRQLIERRTRIDFVSVSKFCVTRHFDQYDVVALETNSLVNVETQSSRFFERLDEARARRGLRVLIFDIMDDSCTHRMDLLPHVDRYVKAYCLADTSRYTERYYGGRIWTDYYHRRHGVVDEPEYVLREFDASHLYKVVPGYCLGLFDHYRYVPQHFGLFGQWMRILPRMAYKPRLANFHPRTKKTNDVQVRFRTSIRRQSLSYHRQLCAERINLQPGKLAHNAYMKELRSSIACVSPFGAGELNLSRDYEAVMSRTVLVKPDMAHLEYWPKELFSKKSTYWVDWDFDNLESTIKHIRANPDEALAKADLALEVLRASVLDGGPFCEFFESLVEV